MKLHSKVTVSALVLGMAAGAAAAQGHSRHDGDGGPGMRGGYGMEQKTMRMHGMMGDRGGMHGMGMMRGMHGMETMGGMQGMRLHEVLDENEDGEVTVDEMRTGLDGLRTEYDADGDGALSIDEFETMHSALIREMMVDRFQHLDADGDGRVTEEEMQRPVRQMERMQRMHERMMNRRNSARDGMNERRGDTRGGMMEQGDGARGGMMDRDGQTDPELGHPMGGTGAAGAGRANN